MDYWLFGVFRFVGGGVDYDFRCVPQMPNQSTLVAAIEKNNLDTVAKLVREFSDLSFITYDGYDLITKAMNHCAEEVASFLIDCDINCANPASGFTPMQCALEQPYYELIDKLLEKRVDLNVKGTEEDAYALHVLCWGYLEPDLLRRFLDAGADPCLRNDDGELPIDVTRNAEGDPEKIREMLVILTDAMASRGCAE
jgi:ankyrin repeat protein